MANKVETKLNDNVVEWDKLTDNQINELIYGNFSVNDAGKDIGAVINDFEYQGFDYIKIFKQIISRGQAVKLTNMAIMRDIRRICYMTTRLGFDVTKFQTKMSPNAKQLLEEWILTYGIRIGAKGARNLNPEDVTFQRIATVFPLQWMEAWSNGFRYIGYSQPNQWTFPKLFCCSLGVLFVDDKDFDNWCQWAHEYNYIINKRSDLKWNDTKNVIAVQRNQTRAQIPLATINAVTKVALNEEVRLYNLCKPLGTGNNKVTDIETPALTAAKTQK